MQNHSRCRIPLYPRLRQHCCLPRIDHLQHKATRQRVQPEGYGSHVAERPFVSSVVCKGLEMPANPTDEQVQQVYNHTNQLTGCGCTCFIQAAYKARISVMVCSCSKLTMNCGAQSFCAQQDFNVTHSVREKAHDCTSQSTAAQATTPTRVRNTKV